jgi:hypothetical protein
MHNRLIRNAIGGRALLLYNVLVLCLLVYIAIRTGA